MNDFTCARCKNDGPQLPGPPMPGPLGVRAYENVCSACWQAWLQYQTALINHHGLNLRDPQAREFLANQSQAFFFEAHEPENFEATKPDDLEHTHITLELNGERTAVAFAPHKTLLEVLREDLGLTGTKHGCELGECGTCAVLVDEQPVLSCLVLGLACDGKRVETVEGMAAADLHPLQTAFADLGAAQCGYCTPGFLLTAQALLAAHPRPTRQQIKEALAGNLCRCTGYLKIYEAVELAAARMRGEEAEPDEETVYGRR